MYSKRQFYEKKAACFALFFSVCAGFAFAQEAVSLDTAIRDAVNYLNGRFPERSKIAIINIESGWPKLSSYVIEELTRHIVNDRRFDLLERDRDRLSQLQDELRFQASGMVSDETAQSIGKYIGAEIIVSGKFIRMGNRYRLSVQALEVESARIAASESFDIYRDLRLAPLLDQKITIFDKWRFSDESWKHKWLYPGARAGYSLHQYTLNSTASDIQADAFSTFEAAVLLEAQIFSLFALQTEIVFSNDRVGATVDNNGITLSSWTAAVPVLAKLTWRPGNCYLAAFAGPHFIFPLGQLEAAGGAGAGRYDFSPTLGLTGGANAGIRLGPGVLFLDLRYSGDFRFVRANDAAQYRRNIFSASLGYNFGLINKTGSGSAK